MDARPLSGVRVLDFTRVLSGPHCTRMLCDLGADVIKIEPPAGDLTRFSNPRRHGLASYFVQQNAGKRNISLDLGRPEGRRLAADLAVRCDVVVENFRPGVMARMGLGYDALAARRPDLVYASISGYGQAGPWAERRAYAPVVGAEAGTTKSQGDARGGVYANDVFSHADVYTGMEAAAAIMAALFQRERTGRGEWIDVSMAQTMLYVNEHVHNELWDEPTPPEWIRSFGNAEYPVVTAANGESVIISGHPAERGTFEMYMRGIERDDLIDDPSLSTVPLRLQHMHLIHGALHAWAATMASAEAIEAALAPQRLATGRLRSVAELCATDWAAHRQSVVQVSDRGGGTVRIPNVPWQFTGSQVCVGGDPKYRGEDNRAVLAELLDLDDATLDELTESGVLSSRLPA
jgi:crotonobetainyl-CoA:carnitine CoA-transferase CaiB-like acyl-CoA transferase